MKFTQQILVFDAADLEAESTFWAGIYGGEVVVDDDWHSITVDGVWRLGIQLAPDHVAPEWPSGGNSQQIHLDLYIEDLEPAHEEAMDLGAKLLQPAEDPKAGSGFQVYASPAGHPFCLCW